jgi:hypothetical protein
MQQAFHRAITTKALQGFFSPPALARIIRANLNQDHWLHGQIGHPEYHFDSNSFSQSRAYIEVNRKQVTQALEGRDPGAAQDALGRLTHAAQDFYAHSNYVSLWLELNNKGEPSFPDEIEPLTQAVLRDTRLQSGKIYPLREFLSWIPMFKRFALHLLPSDSHAQMNLDAPECGPLFPFAISAAEKRTVLEYWVTVQNLEADLLLWFQGRTAPDREV